MQFLKLTEKAKKFITDKCVANTNLFSVTTKIRLPKSNVNAGTTFTATIVDDNNVPITGSTVYAQNLIKWFNQFAEMFVVDPNVAAAQVFQESGFSPLSFTDRNTMGVSGINDYEYFNIIFSATDLLDQSDVDKMKVNVTGDPYQILTWIPNLNSRDGKTKSSNSDNATATANRRVMFQNLANNTKIALFCQFYQLSLYGSKNKNLAATSLFCYYVRANETFDNYSVMLDFMKKKYGSNIEVPKDYVNKIFANLSTFGYDINFQTSLIPYTSDPNNPRNNERLTSITADQLKQFCPKIPAARTPIFLQAINDSLDKFQVNTRLRVAHFMAQIGHESGDLTALEENLNYNAAGLMRVSPFNKYFKTVSDTVGYVGFPEKIANIGYSNRSDIGNGPDPDGYVFRGRGAIGVTGRKRYKFAGDQMGLDLENHPELLADPRNAVISAFYFWQWRGLNAPADNDDIDKVTVLINGGHNGFDDRIVRTKRAKSVLGIG